jgi:uncharacterized membrane protein YphA (DoxX/SURF4 family)
MNRFTKITSPTLFAIVLQLIVGFTFIISALSKIPTLEIFGWTIVETTFLNWTVAEWFARILIGLELFVGIALVLHVRNRNFILPIAFAMMLVFSAYLILIWIQYGNSGNCGCFGELLPMTPAESILKNILLLMMLIVIRQFGFQYNFKFQKMALAILSLICIAFPVWESPPESIYIAEKEPLLNKPIPLSLLYTSLQNKAPLVELRKGKHIVSFMSLTCTFCRKAAKRLRIMKKENPQLPIFIVLNGDSTKLKTFFDDTKASNIDYIHFNGPDEFLRMNGSASFPSIKWVEDTTVIRESNYVTLDEKEILAWIKQ